MKILAVGFASLALAAACGGKMRQTQTPENADETSSNDSDDEGSQASGAKREPNSRTEDAAMKCGGFEVDDLMAVLSKASCELPGAPPEGTQRDVKDLLEVTLKPDSTRIAPGSKSNVRLTLHNKGKADLPLDFVVDPEPRFDFEVYTLKGARADAPRGEAPPLPASSDAPAPDKRVARLVLAPQGTATAVFSFDAVKYKWASREKAKGALPGQGYPREPAGPLPKGKYVLRLVTPLVGVFEGIDHEVSQPRVPIEIGKF